jgi:catechol 2,3-dioxygenase-like lactoylglutathione lyase family enzyme
LLAVEQRISLMTLGVSDLDRSRAFYEALGWSGRSPDGEMWLFQLPGMILGLFDRHELAEDCVVEDNGGWGGIQLTQLVSSPAEVDAILANAEAAGGTIGRTGVQRYWGYTGLFFDPDGHPWEVITHPTWILEDDGSTRMMPANLPGTGRG